MVDQGGTSTVLNIHYEKEELEGKKCLSHVTRESRGCLAWKKQDLGSHLTLSPWLGDPVGKTHDFLCLLVPVLKLEQR